MSEPTNAELIEITKRDREYQAAVNADMVARGYPAQAPSDAVRTAWLLADRLEAAEARVAELERRLGEAREMMDYATNYIPGHLVIFDKICNFLDATEPQANKGEGL